MLKKFFILHMYASCFICHKCAHLWQYKRWRGAKKMMENFSSKFFSLFLAYMWSKLEMDCGWRWNFSGQKFFWGDEFLDIKIICENFGMDVLWKQTFLRLCCSKFGFVHEWRPIFREGGGSDVVWHFNTKQWQRGEGKGVYKSRFLRDVIYEWLFRVNVSFLQFIWNYLCFSWCRIFGSDCPLAIRLLYFINDQHFKVKFVTYHKKISSSFT